MTILNLLFHCLKSCLLPCCCCRGVFPFTICLPPQEPPCQLSCHLVMEPPKDPARAGGDHPHFSNQKESPTGPQLQRKIRTPAALTPPCWYSSSTSDTPLAPLPGFRQPPENRRPTLRSPAPSIWKRSPSLGGNHTRWKPWIWPPYLPPLPGSVNFAPPPSCIARCTNVSRSKTPMATACRTEGIVGGWGFHTPVPPRWPRHSSDRNAPTCLSAFPPSHYTPQVDRASVPPLPGTSPETSWARHPLPLVVLMPNPPRLPCHARFGGVQPVTL